MAGKFVRGRDRAGEKESRAETISDLRLLRAQGVARAKGRRSAAGESWPGISGASPRRGAPKKGNQEPGKERSLSAIASRIRLCKIAGIPEEVSAQTPIIPDHEVLRVIGRGAYGEIWLARTLTGGLRAVKVVYRTTFESERAFQREFQGMSAFEPISRAHAGFVDILHVGRTNDYLYYIMELADDHMAGRSLDIANYEPRTLKSELERQKHLSASESIRLGVSLTEELQALHEHGLTHRDIKPSNIIFIDGKPKLADIGLVAATGQRSFVGTEGYVPP